MEATIIGIGSNGTLHGTPIRAGEVPCVCMPHANEEAEECQEENEDASSGFGSEGKDTNKCVSWSQHNFYQYVQPGGQRMPAYI